MELVHRAGGPAGSIRRATEVRAFTSVFPSMLSFRFRQI
jgi:hypothetical protein